MQDAAWEAVGETVVTVLVTAAWGPQTPWAITAVAAMFQTGKALGRLGVWAICEIQE